MSARFRPFAAASRRGLPTALVVSILLGACTVAIPRDPSSPWFRVPSGSELRLLRRIEIPPGRTRVFFQQGGVTPGFDHYVPSCNIEVRKLEPEAVQSIEPATYRVRSVQDTMEEVVRRETWQLAALAPLLTLGGGDPMIYRGYHLWLEGPDANLMRLSCRGAYDELTEARPPSIEEMRAALGEIARLVLAGEQEGAGWRHERAFQGMFLEPQNRR